MSYISVKRWHKGESDVNVTAAAAFMRMHLRLRNDLYCVEWGVKLYSLTHYAHAPWVSTLTTMMSITYFIWLYVYCIVDVVNADRHRRHPWSHSSQLRFHFLQITREYGAVS